MSDDKLEVGRRGDPITLDHLIEVTESVAEIAILGILRERVREARRAQTAATATNSAATAPQDPESGLGDTKGSTEAQNEPQRPCVHCAASLHRAPCGYWATSDGSEKCWNAFDSLHEPRPSQATETIEATPQAPVPEASADESKSSEGNPERSEGAPGIKSFSEISSEAAEWQHSQDLPELSDEEAEQLAVAKARAIRSMLNAPWKPPT